MKKIEIGDFVRVANGTIYLITDIAVNKFNGNRLLVSCPQKHSTIQEYADDDTSVIISASQVTEIVPKENLEEI